MSKLDERLFNLELTSAFTFKQRAERIIWEETEKKAAIEARKAELNAKKTHEIPEFSVEVVEDNGDGSAC